MKNVEILFFIGIIVSISIFGCGSEEETKNTAPAISSFQANPVSVNVNGQVTLTVIATDVEKDELTYSYQPSGGTITGTGSTVSWVAPSEPGSYMINVSVSDGKLNAQSSVTVTVVTPPLPPEKPKDNTTPVISSFQADPVSVNVDGQVTLTVLATDAEKDELTYSYQSNGGTITGTGNTVTWVAPSEPGSYVINVSVSDGKLNTQSSVTVTVVATPPQENLKELKIQWLGHACFLITSSDGKRVLTDPYSSGIGYTVPSVEADVVTISHSHSDHNNVSMAKGNPEVVRTLGESIAAGISFLGVQSDHDANGGSQRGKNIIFVWMMDDMRLAHLGDLGTLLTDEQLKDMGKIDILFIPVGSVYTIDATQATKVVEQLSPKLVFPMHYKTDVLSIGLAGVDDFLAGKDNVEKVNGNTFVVKELPEKAKVVVLDYK